MDRARYAQKSDPALNHQFNRFREFPPPPPAPRLAPAAAEDAEPGMATLIRWRDDWRARRASRPSREEAPHSAGTRT